MSFDSVGYLTVEIRYPARQLSEMTCCVFLHAQLEEAYY
jgi:hypothetical protein